MPRAAHARPRNASATAVAALAAARARPRLPARVVAREDAGFTEAEQPRHAGMLHPHSSFHIAWDVAMLVLLIYVAIGIPYRTGFGVEPAGGWYPLELCVDLGFCVDVLFNFRMSYVVPGAVLGEDVEISVLATDALHLGWSVRVVN